jgi:anti-sigma regulatory factor (Ser/Thr protein kinase)
MDAEPRQAATRNHRADPAGCHDALIHASDDEFVEVSAQFLHEGAARGEALLVACSDERATLLLQALDDPDSVTVAGNSATYLSPFAALESYVVATRRAVADGATGLRVVGELPPASQDHPHTWPGWARYEALVNHVLTALPFHSLCCYDARQTDPSLLWMAMQTHSHTWDGGVRHANPNYVDPAEYLRRRSDPPVLPIEEAPPLLEVTGIDDPVEARTARARLGDLLVLHDTALLEHATDLSPADPSHVEASEYLLGIDEVLANALTHGAPPVTLRVWGDHDRVVTTVTDSGDGFHDAYAGYSPASADPFDGAPERPRLGLWLARQMCDELSFRHDLEGFTVRLRADLDVRFS